MLTPLPTLFHYILKKQKQKQKHYKPGPIIPFYEKEIEIW